MKLRTFIDRPILACVISVLILMLGLISLFNLPMEQYPDIAPPTVSVSTSYTGANAETVQKSVIVPLEEAINGVENMTYMTSTATNNGSGSITVYFKQGTDPDMATINTKNRVSEAEGLLPAEVTKIGVTVEKRQNSMLKILALYSPDNSYDQTFINNYFKINVEPRLSRITGVGNVNVMGGDYAMRIWLNPQVMAQYSLVPDDVISALGDQNVEAATGTLGEDSENTYQYTLKYRGRYETSEEFGNIVIKSLSNGEVLRLKDYTDDCNRHRHGLHIFQKSSCSVLSFLYQEVLSYFLPAEPLRSVYRLQFRSFSANSSEPHALLKGEPGYHPSPCPSTDHF